MITGCALLHVNTVRIGERAGSQELGRGLKVIEMDTAGIGSCAGPVYWVTEVACS